jgi:hypothetical protein
VVPRKYIGLPGLGGLSYPYIPRPNNKAKAVEKASKNKKIKKLKISP